MKQHIVILACLCGALAYALPVSDSNQENIDLVQIPLKDGKELDILTVGDSDRLSERNKRTIGILRDLFPELSKQVDDSVNKIVGQLIRAIGPSILRTAVRGNTATTNSRTSFDSDFDDDDDSDSASTSGARVKIELPTFDNDDDDDTDNTVASGSSTTTEPNFQYSKNVDAPKSDSDILSISLNSDLINRTDNGGDDADSTDNEDKSNNDDDENKDNDNSENSSDSTTEESGSESGNSSSSASDDDNDSTTKSDDSNNGENSFDVAALNEQLQETIRVARQAQEAEEAEAAGAPEPANPEENETNSNDQQVSESKSPAIDELTLDSEEPDVDDRNKRFLSFGFGGSGGSGAASGGSGNFLFDIIRRTADRAARAAGTVYRVVAGTESLDLNDTGSTSQKLTTTAQQEQQQSGQVNNNERTARTFTDGLFSGSVATQQGDEKANAAISDDDTVTASGDGYTEGIPGPVTRLFVLANRGLSNLIQDLILRIAQTSERVVNFKARLITSLI